MHAIPDSFLRALGWALVHSLWQGAVIAIVLLVLLPRLQKARQRYWAAYGSLLAVLMAAVVTFFWKFEPGSALSASNSFFQGTSPEGISFLIENQYFKTSIAESFSQWLEANHSLIVAFWLIGFMFFLLRLGSGLWQVHVLRTRGTRLLEADWQEKIQLLSGRIGVLKVVNLFESALVHTPLTIGWLKPAILLPIGFVNQLSVAEVEAVLAHELAHIARRDWVFNLVQAFIESLFYYHPAVWWISQVIRRERENACDDAALAATGNPLAFARALVQVQEMAIPLPALALAMSGKRRRPLLERVRRILNQAPQQQHQVMEKITATVILVVLLALVGLRANSVPSIEAAFAQIADFPAVMFGGEEKSNQVESDSLPKPKSTKKVTREDETGRVEAEYNDGELIRLNIDGKDIPQSEFDQHEEVIESLEEDMPSPPDAPFFNWRGGFPASPAAPQPPGFFRFNSPDFPALAPMPPLPPMPPLGGGISIETDKDGEGNTIIRLDNQGENTEVVVKNGELWINGKKLEQGEEFLLPGLHFGQDGQHFFFDGQNSFNFDFGEGDFSWGEGQASAPRANISPEQRERITEEMARAREEHARAMEEYRRNLEQDKKRMDKEWKDNQKEWEKEQKAWEKEQKNWEKEQRKWEREQEKWQAEQLKWEAEQQAWEAKSKAAQELIKKELLRDGLISDPKNFSLKINAKELKVNKKKQSEELRRKYQELIKNSMGAKLEGDDWNYNFNFNDQE